MVSPCGFESHLSHHRSPTLRSSMQVGLSIYSEKSITMEFNEKLQELRKQKGLTQEELAAKLYVTRTAISKWESGRGYPNIDSLKRISSFFGITVDDLLSTEQLLIIANENNNQAKRNACDLVSGLMDISVFLLFFLPIFGETQGELILSVPFLSLVGITAYMQTIYFIIIIGSILIGTFTLALQNWQNSAWILAKQRISFIWNILGVLVFIISQQPYAATLMFVNLIIKVFVTLKSK